MPYTNYNSLYRKDQPDARVMIFIKRDKQRQRKRMTISEHPFGTIKHYDDARYLLCRGKEKVEAEMALSYLAYDIRRVIKLLGVPRLIEAVRRIMPKLQESEGIPAIYCRFRLKTAQIKHILHKHKKNPSLSRRTMAKLSRKP